MTDYDSAVDADAVTRAAREAVSAAGGCPGCGKLVPADAWACPLCGYTLVPKSPPRQKAPDGSMKRGRRRADSGGAEAHARAHRSAPHLLKGRSARLSVTPGGIVTTLVALATLLVLAYYFWFVAR